MHPAPKPPVEVKEPKKTLARKTAMPRSTKPIAKENPERKARRDKSYRKGISAMRTTGVRVAVLLRAGFACERCGYAPEYWWVGKQIRCPELHVHHKHKRYARLGKNEDLALLEALCKWCHGKEHPEKTIQSRPTRRIA